MSRICIYVGNNFDYRRILTGLKLSNIFTNKGFEVLWLGSSKPSDIKRYQQLQIVDIFLALAPFRAISISYAKGVGIKFDSDDTYPSSFAIYNPVKDGLFGKDEFETISNRNQTIGIQCFKAASIPVSKLKCLHTYQFIRILEKKEDTRYCNKPPALYLDPRLKFPNLLAYIHTNSNDISKLSYIQAIVSGVLAFEVDEIRPGIQTKLANYNKTLHDKQTLIDESVITWSELAERIEGLAK